jgi:hypothetical protein
MTRIVSAYSSRNGVNMETAGNSAKHENTHESAAFDPDSHRAEAASSTARRV